MNRSQISLAGILGPIVLAVAASSGAFAEGTQNLFNRTVSLEQYPGWLRQYLGSRKWQQREAGLLLNRSILEKSLQLGRQFMLNNQKPAGNFNYQYDFVRRRQSRRDSQVRQAGALWGIALFCLDNPAKPVRKALDQGLRFFFKHTQEGFEEGSLLIAYPGAKTCDTGAVALIGLSIIEYLTAAEQARLPMSAEQRAELLRYLRGYLAYLQSVQLDNGHFASAYYFDTKSISVRSSPYFDGETMLCMVKAAKYLGFTGLIPRIEKTALLFARDYTVRQWRKDRDSSQTKGFFQWSCMAFHEYYDAGWRNAEVFGDYVLALAWWMIHVHHTLDKKRNTAYAYEGIIQAYRIAQRRGLELASDDLRYVIDRGLHKLTSWQVGGPLAGKNPFLKAHPTDDGLAIGGITNHSSEAPLRIDVTQHQMHSVLLALEHVYREPAD